MYIFFLSLKPLLLLYCFEYLFHLFRNRKETISNRKLNPEEIDRIKFKLFHLTSILLLRAFDSSIVMDSKLVLSNISFKGIFTLGIYWTGVFGVTILGNIPLNEILDKTNLESITIEE